MDIFVSWAGRDSHAVAVVLRRWLPEVLPFVRPWVSSEDIRKGTRWSDELWGRLQGTSYCIVCLTPGAVRSPWVNFEAGAIAKAVRGPSHVSPLLLGISPRDLDGSPLAMFQCTEFAEQDVHRLLNAINSVAIAPVPVSQITAGLRRTWAALHDEISRIDFSSTNDADQAAARDDETVDDWLHEIEDKILEHVAWAGDQQPVDLLQIAQAVGEDHIVTQHYVDRLVARSFLHEKLNVAYPPTYLVTRRGRAHLVEGLL